MANTQTEHPELGVWQNDTLAEKRFRVGLGDSFHSHDVAVREASTFGELFDQIAATPSTTSGDGPYICAPMRGGVRNKDNAEPTRILMLDFDTLSADEGVRLKQAIKDMNVQAVLWSTKSHVPEKPRLRLMIALSEEVKAADYGAVHAAFMNELNCKGSCTLKVDQTSAGAFQPQVVPLATSTVIKYTEADRHPFDIAVALGAESSGGGCEEGSKSLENGKDKLPDDPIVSAAKSKGLHPVLVKPGVVGVRCPWKEEHTGESAKSSSALLLPNYDGRKSYGYKCLHAHCTHRHIDDFLKFLDVSEPNTTKIELPLDPIPTNWLDVALPPKEFLVDGWIPAGTVGLLVAEGGTGKTNLALRLAMSVAGGRDLLGIPTKYGTAVVLALEDPEDVIRRRIKSMYDSEQSDPVGLKVFGPPQAFPGNSFRENLGKRLLQIAGRDRATSGTDRGAGSRARRSTLSPN